MTQPTSQTPAAVLDAAVAAVQRLGQPKVATTALLAALDAAGHQLTARELSNRLACYGVRPTYLRSDGAAFRGYRSADLVAAHHASDDSGQRAVPSVVGALQPIGEGAPVAQAARSHSPVTPNCGTDPAPARVDTNMWARLARCVRSRPPFDQLSAETLIDAVEDLARNGWTPRDLQTRQVFAGVPRRSSRPAELLAEALQPYVGEPPLRPSSARWRAAKGDAGA